MAKRGRKKRVRKGKTEGGEGKEEGRKQRLERRGRGLGIHRKEI